MRGTRSPIHDASLELTAEGFTVTQQPRLVLRETGATIQPDLVAIRGNEGLLVEIKRREDEIPPLYVDALERLARQQGWELVLWGVDDATPPESPTWPDQHPSSLWFQAEAPDALLRATAAAEATAREVIEREVDEDVQPDWRSMLNMLVAYGLLAQSEYASLHAGFEIRDAWIHGYGEPIPQVPHHARPRLLRSIARQLLDRHVEYEPNQSTRRRRT